MARSSRPRALAMLPYKLSVFRAILPVAQILVPVRSTPGLQVDQNHAIVGENRQGPAGLHFPDPLSCLDDRHGAVETDRVEDLVCLNRSVHGVLRPRRPARAARGVRDLIRAARAGAPDDRFACVAAQRTPLGTDERAGPRTLRDPSMVPWCTKT